MRFSPFLLETYLQSDAQWEHAFTLLSGNKLKSDGGFPLLLSHERIKKTAEDFEREQERKTSLKLMNIL